MLVPGSSYLVYQGNLTKDSPISCIPCQVNKDSKMVTFYTFDGNPILTVEHHFDFDNISFRLDPSALPPKPVSYRRIWMPAFKVDSCIVEAGYMVLIHDKYGNRMGWELLKSIDENVKSWLEYDLSNAYEEESDYSLKELDIDLIENNLSDTQINFSRKTKIDFGASNMNLSRIEPSSPEIKEQASCIIL